MFTCAKLQVQADRQLGRPWAFEPIVMAVLLEQEKRIGEMVRRIEESTTGRA
jgi:hypothetical protein